jgi:hypothetical protein
MDSKERMTQQLHDTLKECFVQIRFARAAELARFGRYLAAEGLLSPNGREPSDPKELDLLARISARQRRYRRARRLWEIALKQSPGNADYVRAIERTREAERFQAMLRKAAMLALLGLAVTALVIAVWSSFHRHSLWVAKGGNKRPDLHSKATPPPLSSPKSAQPTFRTPPTANATAQPTPTTPQPEPATTQPALSSIVPQPAAPPVAPKKNESPPLR